MSMPSSECVPGGSIVSGLASGSASLVKCLPLWWIWLWMPACSLRPTRSQHHLQPPWQLAPSAVHLYEEKMTGTQLS
ncbi:hypothetical protein SUGI_0593770 [Cryptomeria japonica]|nr:hypothetical protein SUGI_0593770 [Cryptomeria japonica]